MNTQIDLERGVVLCNADTHNVEKYIVFYGHDENGDLRAFKDKDRTVIFKPDELMATYLTGCVFYNPDRPDGFCGALLAAYTNDGTVGIGIVEYFKSGYNTVVYSEGPIPTIPA